MHRPPHILSAATNLLGICLIIITGLKLASANGRSYADELTWGAAALLFVAAVNAYLAIRNQGALPWQDKLADIAFLAGMSLLALAVAVAAIFL